MFKYTVAVQVKNPNFGRGASVTIKSLEDLNIRDNTAMQIFVHKHNIVPSMERMFGEGNVQECRVVDKTATMQRA